MNYVGQNEVVPDGWDMDDGDVEDFDWEDDDKQSGHADVATTQRLGATATLEEIEAQLGGELPQPSASNNRTHNSVVTSVNDGWNDDDLELSETSRIENTTTAHKTKSNVTAARDSEIRDTSSGWDDGFDLDVDDDDDDDGAWNTQRSQPAIQSDPGPGHAPPPVNATTIRSSFEPSHSSESASKQNMPSNNKSRLYAELQDYLLLLPALAPSISAVLQAEYNTPTKALELQQYYAERPALAAYTIEKELPRMTYVLTDSQTGDVVDDKGVIASQLQTASARGPWSASLCARCANQSLLADMLQVLSGPDRVIRSQYYATAVATACRFRVDLGLGLVEVQSSLDVSLPLEQGRWKVAELRIMILFECGSGGDTSAAATPRVEFRLLDIVPRASPRDGDWSLKLEQCCTLLEMLAVDMDPGEFSMKNDISMQTQQNFRDVFLQSQNRLQASATNAVIGMKAAWQDFDAATGLQRKWKQLPTLLPDASVWQAAEEAQNEEERQRLHESAAAAASVARQHHSVAQADPRQLVPPPRQQPQQQRPTSILGGLVRSLAKSVALPEEDASLYQDWKTTAAPSAATSSPAPPAAPVPISIPRLYNQETPPTKPKPPLPVALQAQARAATVEPPSKDPAGSNSEIPRLYNTTAAPTTKTAASSSTPVIPGLYNTETPPSVRKPAVSKGIVGAASALSHDHHPNGKTVFDEAAGSGWDDDDLDLDVEITPPQPKLQAPDDIDPSTWVYDPETDVIPTRKRWINPRIREDFFVW
jgi:hypothetical protein